MFTSRSLVIDSSVAFKWFNKQGENYIEQAEDILKRAQKNTLVISMPELAKYEIINALLFKKSSEKNIFEAINLLYSLPINFTFLNESRSINTYKLAKEFAITFYDASFIALALDLGCPLVTANPKHQDKKLEGLNVISLKDY